MAAPARNLRDLLDRPSRTPSMHDAAPSPLQRRAAAVVALSAAGVLALQYLLILLATRDNVGPLLGTVRFFSYFTILSNLGVLLVTAQARFAPHGVFMRPWVRGAVALYIGITGVVYVAILQSTWDPQGAWLWADIGLHYLVPVLYLGWWLASPGHGQLGWRHAVAWLAFPLAYLGWLMLRGAWLAEYPYPFVDVDALGWRQVLANAAILLGVFLALGLALVVVDRLLARRAVALRTAG